jgi:hypothetical protein
LGDDTQAPMILAAGVYLVKVHIDGFAVARRLVVTR